MLRNGIPEEVDRRAAKRLAQLPRLGIASGGDQTAARRRGDRGSATAPCEVLHRPGHSPSDTFFWDAERRILIAADHLIAHISSNPLITRPLDGSERRTQALVTYIDSMQKTREMPAEIVLSGHGEPITDHVALIDERLGKHQRRKEKIYRLIAEQPRSGYQLAQAIWGNVAVTQAFLTLSEVIGHADLLINEGRVRELDDAGVIRYETTS